MKHILLAITPLVLLFCQRDRVFVKDKFFNHKPIELNHIQYTVNYAMGNIYNTDGVWERDSVQGENIHGYIILLHFPDSIQASMSYYFRNPVLPNGDYDPSVPYMYFNDYRGPYRTTDSSGYVEIIKVESIDRHTQEITGYFEGSMVNDSSETMHVYEGIFKVRKTY